MALFDFSLASWMQVPAKPSSSYKNRHSISVRTSVFTLHLPRRGPQSRTSIDTLTEDHTGKIMKIKKVQLRGT